MTLNAAESQDEVLNQKESKASASSPEVEHQMKRAWTMKILKDIHTIKKTYQPFQPRNKSEDREELEGHWVDKKGMSMDEPMNAYYGMKPFKGGWIEDLDNLIQVYETLSNMWKVTTYQMLRSTPVMFSGDAVSFFSSKMRGCTTHNDATAMMRRWYNSDEKKH